MKRELVLTSVADETFSRLIQALRNVTGTRLTASHAFRSLMRVLGDALPRLESVPRSPLPLPSNARGYESDRERFEQVLAELIRKAVTKSPV